MSKISEDIVPVNKPWWFSKPQRAQPFVIRKSSCRLLLNMLIGVMCEVVSGVSQSEREVIAEAFVREKARWSEAKLVVLLVLMGEAVA